MVDDFMRINCFQFISTRVDFNSQIKCCFKSSPKEIFALYFSLLFLAFFLDSFWQSGKNIKKANWPRTIMTTIYRVIRSFFEKSLKALSLSSTQFTTVKKKLFFLCSWRKWRQCILQLSWIFLYDFLCGWWKDISYLRLVSFSSVC